MDYKMHFTGQGVLKPSKLDKTSRPIQAYMKNQLDTDIYCSVTVDSESPGKELVVKILDSGVSENLRGLYPIIKVGRLDAEKLPENFHLNVKIESSLGNFGYSEGGKRLMRKLWTKTVPELLTVLTAAEAEYCSNSFSKSKAWLNTLNTDQIRKMKKHLAGLVGQKVHPSWE